MGIRRLVIYLTNTEPLYWHHNTIDWDQYQLHPVYDTIIAVAGGPKCFTFAEQFGDEKTKSVYIDLDPENLKYKKQLWDLVYKEKYNLKSAIDILVDEHLNKDVPRVNSENNYGQSMYYRYFRSMSDVIHGNAIPNGLRSQMTPGLSGLYFKEPEWDLISLYDLDSVSKYFHGKTLLFVSNALEWGSDKENKNWFNTLKQFPNVDVVHSAMPESIVEENSNQYYINNTLMINKKTGFVPSKRKIHHMDNFMIYVVDDTTNEDPLFSNMSYNVLEHSLKRYPFKYFKDYKTADEELHNESYERVVFIKPGFYGDLEKLLENIEHYSLVGHILDFKDEYYTAHQQCVVLNVTDWDRVGRPSILDNGDVMTYITPDRSEENYHDDYTPLWVKSPEDKPLYKTYNKTHLFGGVINAFLSRSYAIRPFNPIERELKFWTYDSMFSYDTQKVLNGKHKSFDIDTKDIVYSQYHHNIDNEEPMLDSYPWRPELYSWYLNEKSSLHSTEIVVE